MCINIKIKIYLNVQKMHIKLLYVHLTLALPFSDEKMYMSHL